MNYLEENKQTSSDINDIISKINRGDNIEILIFFFKKNFPENKKYNTEALLYILKKNNIIGFSRNDVLKIMNLCDLLHQDKYFSNILMILIEVNNYRKLGFSKENILSILDKFDLNQTDLEKCNILMYIIRYNKLSLMGFNKKDILDIIDKFDLIQQDYCGNNILMYICYNNETEELGFTENDIFSILDKFDLSQKNIYGSIYDLIDKHEHENSFFLKKDFIPKLIPKLNIEMRDKNEKIILIKELNNGMCFDGEELTNKILNTKNKDIINCVYQHIHQITWKKDELLLFLHKNNFGIIPKITQLI